MFAQCFWSAGPGTRCVAGSTAASAGLLLLSANEPGTLPERDPNAGLWLQAPYTYTKPHPGLPARQEWVPSPHQDPRGVMASSSPYRLVLGAHLASGREPTRHSPHPQQMGKWGESCSSDSDVGVGRGPHRIR